MCPFYSLNFKSLQPTSCFLEELAQERVEETLAQEREAESRSKELEVVLGVVLAE
jgi:hypothetical protein